MATIANKPVGTTGLGLMGFMFANPPLPFTDCIATMRAALDAGATFWNAGEFYGTPERNTLHLLHSYFTTYPQDASRVVLSVKGATAPGSFNPDSSPSNIARSINECLRILDGVKSIDIFQCARVDPSVPIEDNVRSLAAFVRNGKIGGIGLSETGAGTIRRAAAVHRIAAVEVEYSLFTTDIERNGVREACADLDIPIVAYSPLGRGFLSGKYKTAEDVHPLLRQRFPRFADGVLEENLKLARRVEEVAARKGVPPAQLALGWVRRRSRKEGWPVVLPIPGATRTERVLENMVDVEIGDEEERELEEVLREVQVQGARYPPGLAELEFA